MDKEKSLDRGKMALVYAVMSLSDFFPVKVSSLVSPDGYL